MTGEGVLHGGVVVVFLGLLCVGMTGLGVASGPSAYNSPVLEQWRCSQSGDTLTVDLWLKNNRPADSEVRFRPLWNASFYIYYGSPWFETNLTQDGLERLPVTVNNTGVVNATGQARLELVSMTGSLAVPNNTAHLRITIPSNHNPNEVYRIGPNIYRYGIGSAGTVHDPVDEMRFPCGQNNELQHGPYGTPAATDPWGYEAAVNETTETTDPVSPGPITSFLTTIWDTLTGLLS